MEKEITTFFEKAKSASISDVDFLFYLNLSVLAGEYIFDADRLFKRDKTERFNTTKNEVKSADDDSENDTEESKPSITPKSLLNRESLIDKYSYFSKNITDNLNYLCEGISYSQIDVDILRSSSLHRILDGDIFEPKDNSVEDDEIRNLRNLFFLNIFIADYDENLESDKSCEKELKEIEKFLMNFPESNKALEISKVLLDKTRYLLFKIRYRSKPYRELKFHDEVGLLDTNAVSLNQKHDLYISKDNVFFEFVKKTIIHYEKKKQELQPSKEEQLSKHFILIGEEFDKKEIKLHSISFFFEYNRYLKKVKKDYGEKIEILERIITEVESRITDAKNVGNKFEILSYKSCKNLLSNTKFRLFLLQLQKPLKEGAELFNDSFYKDPKPSLVLEFFENITKERKKIPPYFDYKQYEVQMDFFDNLIETLMDQEMILEKFSFLSGENINNESDALEYDQYLKNIYAKIATIKVIYLEFLDRFNCWDLESKDLGLLPIYLGKEDCIISYKMQTLEDEKEITIEINLFLDSSYVLPVDYSRIDEKKAEEKLQLDAKIQVIKSKIEALYNYKKSKIAAEDITKQIQVFREETESKTFEFEEKIEDGESKFEKKIKDGEFKTIQTVALFVTIASFVLMQVKIYDNKSGIESIAITFSLAGILVLFNGIFHWMIESQKEDGNKNIFCKLYSLITTPVIFVSLLLLGTGVSFFFLTKIKGWDMDSEKNKMLEEKVTVLKETQKMSLNLKEDSMRITELKKEIDLLKKRNK
jgi:hypothetical protein